MIASSINGAKKIDFLHVEERNRTFVSPCRKINSKCNRGLNLRPEILKLLSETKTLQAVHRGKDILNRTPVAQEE